ncbi:dTDP-4-dehydrorhamnose reductase [Polynucleobacter asymbioticus]|uniref:dTDP-4-dehydrorhamnose reductase n=1 Tax=Polynucleobacter asymbioticus TaxID=576611 RepID=A0AAC9NHM9_9BURK|nr:dTDP-4-dehydrorhamnose reductase [Polynucleobacter asymbioticus]APB98102.1 NAD(P)-dependent oxidoreductase [Polynucleobacter asymbioticus]APC00388.1 NAD(P)-dependent oxidoreductase [Polynucleobacter asymbioticus]
MKVLVFGKDGQLGKAFQDVFFSHQPSNEIQVQFLGRTECDLSNSEAVTAALKAAKANLIINASAYTAVDKAETEMDLAYAINARAPELMAAYAAEHGATFLHYSTDYVFDGEKYGFYLEDDLRNPLGVYGKSKAAGEEGIARIFANSQFGQYAILRTSWVYGDGGNFIRTILRLAKEREELKVIADQYGVPTSAQWLARTSLKLAINDDDGLRAFPSGIYHAVPAGETTWHGLATLAISTAIEAGVALKTEPKLIKPIPATEYPLPAPRPANSRMSTDKLQSALAVSGSYNDPKQSLEFPQWEQMVQDYVRKLASSGVI